MFGLFYASAVSVFIFAGLPESYQQAPSLESFMDNHEISFLGFLERSQKATPEAPKTTIIDRPDVADLSTAIHHFLAMNGTLKLGKEDLKALELFKPDGPFGYPKYTPTPMLESRELLLEIFESPPKNVQRSIVEVYILAHEATVKRRTEWAYYVLACLSEEGRVSLLGAIEEEILPILQDEIDLHDDPYAKANSLIVQFSDHLNGKKSDSMSKIIEYQKDTLSLNVQFGWDYHSKIKRFIQTKEYSE